MRQKNRLKEEFIDYVTEEKPIKELPSKIKSWKWCRKAAHFFVFVTTILFIAGLAWTDVGVFGMLVKFEFIELWNTINNSEIKIWLIGLFFLVLTSYGFGLASRVRMERILSQYWHDFRPEDDGTESLPSSQPSYEMWWGSV